nr:MAG: bacterial regulatory protein, arsR family [Candidatus Nanosalinarum sp. J07AB56]
MAKIWSDGKLLGSESLTQTELKALADPNRLEMMERLAEEPRYASELGRELNLDEQTAHYHFEKLKDADLIERVEQRDVSGGMASFYRPRTSLHIDLGNEDEEFRPPEGTDSYREFLGDSVDGSELELSVVVGAPEPHGPDQVKARDGHLAGRAGFVLGRHFSSQGLEVVKDTDGYGGDRLVIGGPRTNMEAERLQDRFGFEFASTGRYKYSLQTPEETYTSKKVGVVASSSGEPNAFLLAGVGYGGTLASLEAFESLPQLDVNLSGDTMVVFEGLDMDGDGQVDDFELLEVG